MKVTFDKSQSVTSHSVNAVQHLADGRVTGVSRNLNPGWLDRCAKDSTLEMTTINPQRLSGTSDSGVESMESSIYSPKEGLVSTVHSASSLQVSDEEEFICNSESEEERTNKRVRNFKKCLNDQDGRPTKRQCIQIDSNITDSDTFKLTSAEIKSSGSDNLIAQFFESVSNDTVERNTSTSSSTKLTAKEKLEKKMTAGTMNDNFVRINLKKKVFVRGKKNFNFSKYKKNQWKQRKKDLASSESNLDAADFIDKNGMTCLKCGESGHFAKNCSTFKGNALLPLEEIDDSSNFPTLEEAEKMASKTAVVAHSHKIERLPERPSYSAMKTSRDEKAELGELIFFLN